MGHVTGFIDHKRSTELYREPATRIKDWKEIAQLPSEKVLKEQASRCMDCGVPFCQDGTELAGMTTGCPIYNLIPEWNDLIFRGDWKEAYQRLIQTNPFPEFTGRVCPAPCEGACVASLANESVTIKNIERAIIDRAFEEGWVQPKVPEQRTGRNVAVIGSGPAGLSSAATLNQYGHHVTVYERDDRIGGLLTYGIPKMKLEQEVVDRRIKVLTQEGVRFICGVEVGTDVTLEQLQEEYDAVILCVGSTVPRNAEVPGRENQGIHFAMDYLHMNTKRLLDADMTEEYLTAEGKDVIVIGGGDTATDCVSSAIRQNCKSLVQFDIYPKKPDQRAEDNPWPQFPLIHKMDTGQEEAAHVFGRDPREFSTMALTFLGDKNGHVNGLKSTQVETRMDAYGRKSRKPITKTEKEWPVQLVLLAIGFEGTETNSFTGSKVKVNERAQIAVKKDSYETDETGVFTAGDAKRGASLIVWAMQEGKEAAKECHEYLMDNIA
jgi:glutamate synthase (NADPH/NADH) small chain